MSPHEIASIWRAGGGQPPRVESLTFSPDPELEAKITDVVGLSLDPPQHASVLCVDDKPQVQALERAQPVLPAVPGVPERRSHDDYRHGVSSLFAAVDIATGKVVGACYPRPTNDDFLAFLQAGGQRISSRTSCIWCWTTTGHTPTPM